eukprot:2321479-Heterocapsa_arctica.AAC.1
MAALESLRANVLLHLATCRAPGAVDLRNKRGSHPNLRIAADLEGVHGLEAPEVLQRRVTWILGLGLEPSNLRVHAC